MLRAYDVLHCRDGFNDGSRSDDFVNPFHYCSPVRRYRNMGCYENGDWDLSIRLEITNYIGAMKGEECYDCLNIVEKVYAYKDFTDHRKG